MHIFIHVILLRDFKAWFSLVLSMMCFVKISISSGYYFQLQTKFGGYIGITLSVCLSIRLSVRPSVQSNLNLDHNVWTESDRALILHKCIPCDMTFLSIPKFLTLWPWPWLLTYFWKNLTLATTFEPQEIGLLYLTCVFVVARPSCWNQKFFISWPWLLTYFWKNLT